MNRRINVAIDGPSGSGKSTVAKLIAKKYGFKYINTGLVYRAIALNAINKNVDLNNKFEILYSISDGMIVLKENEIVILNGVDVSKELRSDNISQAASKVAAIDSVRSWASELQRSYAQHKGIIMDGRDTTFNIMPDADVKIFLDTSAEVRAKRRITQNKDLGFNTNYEEVLREIRERDNRDRTRTVDPLHKVEGAILIDASNMSIDDVVKKISSEIDNKLK